VWNKLHFMRRIPVIVFWMAIAFPGGRQLYAQDWPHYHADTIRRFSPGCDTLPVYAYFQVKGKYPESSQSLAARAEAALSAHKRAPDANGHITFRVLIDCAGKMAGVRLLQTNTRYEPCQFPDRLVDGLYSFLRSLNHWKPAARAGRGVNYSAYLSFKIEGGHVVQVSP
jgi:hypothetical protein